jgi:hypothetical protein
LGQLFYEFGKQLRQLFYNRALGQLLGKPGKQLRQLFYNPALGQLLGKHGKQLGQLFYTRAPLAQAIDSLGETATDYDANAQVLRALPAMARAALYEATLPSLTVATKFGDLHACRKGSLEKNSGVRNECNRLPGTTRAIPTGWTLGGNPSEQGLIIYGVCRVFQYLGV